MQINSILENIEKLPLNQQINLVKIIQNRIIQKKRDNILKNSDNAEKEYEQGLLKEESAEDLTNKLSE